MRLRPHPLFALVMVLAACSAAGSTSELTQPPPSTLVQMPPTEASVTTQLPVVPPTRGEIVSTSPGSDGARYAEGRGALHATDPLDVELPEQPVWVVGASAGDAVRWWVALQSGEIVEVLVEDGEAFGPRSVGVLPPGAPPAVAAVEGGLSLVHPPQNWGSPLSHPLGVGEIGFAIEGDGMLRVESPAGVVHHDLDVPGDARLLTDGERLLVVTGATSRYPHAALGDTVEGSSVTLLEGGEPRVLFELDDPAVIEGTVPMWVDLDGDGGREILVTVSDPGLGARLMLYDEAGAELATGPAIGQGNRWRHQVAAAPLGPNGEMEVAAVRTPHIGGEVQFYRWSGAELDIVARVRGFSSHRFLSHNLDMSLAADADGDGRVELVVPTDDYRTLGVIARTGDGAVVEWTVPIGGLLATNLGVANAGGRLSFAAGTEEGVLRVWW